MTFLAPTFHFAFLLAAAVPLILYLLFRRRKRDVAWGASYILRRLLQSKSKVSAWKQYAIIAIRTLAFVALPLVFLWPHRPWQSETRDRFPGAPGAMHRVLLLDVSPSMDAAYGTGSALDAAVSLCRKVLQSGRYPGRVDVATMEAGAEPFSVTRLPVRSEQLERLITDMHRSGAEADHEAGLRAAVQLFRASRYEGRELYILSDFSADDLASLDGLSSDLRQLERLGVDVRMLAYQKPDGANFALHEFTPQLDLLLKGQPTLFYVTVGYYGVGETADTWLAIRDEAGETLYEEALTLAPGRRTLEIPLSLDAGERRLTASLREDDYASDNALACSLQVNDALRVLVLQDINLSKGFSNPREWLSLSLGDSSGGSRMSENLKARLQRGMMLQQQLGHSEISEADKEAITAVDDAHYKTIVDFGNSAQLNAGLLLDRDGVIVLDVDTLTDDAVEALRQYAVRGGTVFLAPGPTADAARFNKSMAVISPARLAAPRYEKIDPDEYQSAVLEAAGDRILREIESPQQGHIGNARFYNHYVVPSSNVVKQADTLFSLSGGAPLLMSRKHGRGACMLWTAGLGMEWQSMVVHAAYPVFFSRVFNAAASSRRFPLNLALGEPILRGVDAEACQVVRPDDKVVDCRAVAIGDSYVLRYEQTDVPGRYILRSTPQSSVADVHVVVSGERRESDYRMVPDELQEGFEDLTGGPIHKSEKGLIEAVGTSYPGRPLAAQAAALLFLLLLLEAGLSRWWFA